MSFTRSCSLIDYTYLINNINLSSTSYIKNLGVIFSSGLNFHYHIQSIKCKEYKTLGFVKRISSDFKRNSLVKALYCFLVRPLLEYSSVLWDLHTASDSVLIECVQKCFLPYAGNMLNILHPMHDYSPVFRELRLSTLTDSRVVFNLNFFRYLIDNSPTCLHSYHLLTFASHHVGSVYSHLCYSNVRHQL